MRNSLLFFIIVLTVTASVMLFGQVAGVVAIGAATDNATMPSMPTGDQSHDIIEPLVKYVLIEPERSGQKLKTIIFKTSVLLLLRPTRSPQTIFPLTQSPLCTSTSLTHGQKNDMPNIDSLVHSFSKRQNAY